MTLISYVTMIYVRNTYEVNSEIMRSQYLTFNLTAFGRSYDMILQKGHCRFNCLLPANLPAILDPHLYVIGF